MAPEYAMQGHFSVKSDVFSFGVLVLEIKNSFRNGNDIEHLLSHVSIEQSTNQTRYLRLYRDICKPFNIVNSLWINFVGMEKLEGRDCSRYDRSRFE
jgi:serine/threonine protein kinase